MTDTSDINADVDGESASNGITSDLATTHAVAPQSKSRVGPYLTRQDMADIFQPDSFDVIFYHNHCPDGIGAAYPFWRENRTRFEVTQAWEELATDPAVKIVRSQSDRPFQLIGVNNHDLLPNIDLIDKVVAVVDFTFNREVIETLTCQAKYVLILDHHETTSRHVAGLDIPNLWVVIDMERSAAQIAWDWMYPPFRKDAHPSENDGYWFGSYNTNDITCSTMYNTQLSGRRILRPWFIEYIADRDLWRWQLPNSKIISKALFHGGYFRWEVLETLARMSPTEDVELRRTLISQGKHIDQVDQKNIAITCRYAVVCTFYRYRVKLVTFNPHLRSEIGNRLAGNGCDFAACANYIFLKDEWHVSLRGPTNSTINIAEICEVYGGGGHPKAGKFIIYGPKSRKWRTSTPIERVKLTSGSLHDYFYPISFG